LLPALRQRGLRKVECLASDDHAGLKKAIQEFLPEAAWQRCYVHFLRNALDYLLRKADDDCLMECAGCTTGEPWTKHGGTWLPS
jgi:transposase-like protein